MFGAIKRFKQNLAVAKDNGSANSAGRDINFINVNQSENQSENCWLKIDEKIIEKHKQYKCNLLDYILGAYCKWNMVFNDLTVPREIVQKIVDDINDYHVQALIGAGGEGKSTILKQIAYLLYKKGWTVYYYLGKNINLFEQENIDRNKTVFIVDDVTSINKFDDFLSKIITNEYKMIFSSRINEWEVYKQNINIRDNHIHYVEIGTINEIEADNFAEYIINNSETSLSKSEIKENFLHNNYGFLYAAMLCSVHGENLEKISENIIDNIYKYSKDIAQVLAGICLLESLDIKTDIKIYQKMYRGLDIEKRVISKCLRKEVKIVNNAFIETRHPLISQLFCKYLYENEDSYFQKEDIWRLVFGYYNDVNLERGIENCIKIKKRLLVNFISEQLYDSEDEFFQYLIEIPVVGELLNIFVNYVAKTDSEKAGEFLKIIVSYPRYANNSACWRRWAEYEYKKGNIGEVDKENTACWICRQGVEQCGNAPDLWIKWAEYEYEKGNIGEVNEENTACWICKQGLEQCGNTHDLWLKWAEYEYEKGNIGEVNEKNTACWICKQGLEQCGNTPDLWIKWAEYEYKKGNIGEVDKENTACWICRQGVEQCGNAPDLWIKWAEYEYKKGNIGEVDKENTACWICRQGVEQCGNAPDLWIKWAEYEYKKGNIGEVNKENTVRWICKQGVEKCGNKPDLWLKWAEYEYEKGNIGEVSEENTVRWICKQGVEKCGNTHQLWQKWAEYEYKKGNIGEVNEENTACWICKQGLEQCGNTPGLWLKWANYEYEKGNIGEVNEENTACWICKQGVEKCGNTPHLWQKWAEYEYEKGNIGEVNEENTACWICKQGLEQCGNTPDLWIKWAEYEYEKGNIGEVNEENTVRWILHKGVNTCNSAFYLWLFWIKLEVQEGCLVDAKTFEEPKYIILKNGIEKYRENFKRWILGAKRRIEKEENDGCNTDDSKPILLFVDWESNEIIPGLKKMVSLLKDMLCD